MTGNALPDYLQASNADSSSYVHMRYRQGKKRRKSTSVTVLGRLIFLVAEHRGSSRQQEQIHHELRHTQPFALPILVGSVE